MALATQGTHAGFQAAWRDIKTIASGSDPALAMAQIADNPRYTRIVEALKYAAGAAVGGAEVLALIRRVEVLPLDFQQAQSKDERDAIAVARSLLVDGTQEDAKTLWSDIVGHARETRLASGTLDFAALLRWLRQRFLLKGLPDFEPSWNRLRALSAETESSIKTALSSGARFDLMSNSGRLREQLGANPCLVVYGKSGTGKSALVKSFLETHFPKAARLWLVPEHLEQALDEAERVRFGVVHPLIQVLDAAVTPVNFLILDAAERLTPQARVKAQQLVAQLLVLNGTETPPPWRVIIVGQTEFWVSGDLQKIAGTPSPPQQEVGLRSTGEVASVLRASPGLEWLASHHDALLALTNLRTLAWVVQASGVFLSSGPAPASLVAIAEKLWSHWTAGRTALQGFLMRLAVRDAAFEHSVPISTLDPADAKAFDERPQQCPVRCNVANNHVQFEHDLAADWARFQQLKEIAADTAPAAFRMRRSQVSRQTIFWPPLPQKKKSAVARLSLRAVTATPSSLPRTTRQFFIQSAGAGWHVSVPMKYARAMASILRRFRISSPCAAIPQTTCQARPALVRPALQRSCKDMAASKSPSKRDVFLQWQRPCGFTVPSQQWTKGRRCRACVVKSRVGIRQGHWPGSGSCSNLPANSMSSLRHEDLLP